MHCLHCSKSTNQCLPQYCGWQKRRFKANQFVWYIGWIGMGTGWKGRKRIPSEKCLKRGNLKPKQTTWLWKKKKKFELQKATDLVVVIFKTIGNKPEGILSSKKPSAGHIQILTGWYILTPSAKWLFSLNQYEGHFFYVPKNKTVGQAEIRTKLFKSKILLHSIFSSFLSLLWFFLTWCLRSK